MIDNILKLNYDLNNSTRFLLYGCEFNPYFLLKRGLVNAYLEDYSYTKSLSTQNIEDLYLAFDPLQVEDLDELHYVFTNHENYLDKYFNDKLNYIIYRIKFSKQWEHIKKEFYDSKYSKIDRNYVELFFPSHIPQFNNENNQIESKRSRNHQILTKCQDLKKYLEKVLDVNIDDDLELHSKLDLNKEILNYGIK